MPQPVGLLSSFQMSQSGGHPYYGETNFRKVSGLIDFRQEKFVSQKSLLMKRTLDLLKSDFESAFLRRKKSQGGIPPSPEGGTPIYQKPTSQVS
jgi:hypothetical protein